MAAEDPLRRALGLAFSHLGRRDRTIAEVGDHLMGRGVDPPTIERALESLRKSGYLDDERYARRFAEDRRVLDGWGQERIEGGLLKVGIDPELAASIARPAEPDAEMRRALLLLDRRFPAGLCDDRERRRALGLLTRRGYELELAYDAIRAHERASRAA